MNLRCLMHPRRLIGNTQLNKSCPVSGCGHRRCGLNMLHRMGFLWARGPRHRNGYPLICVRFAALRGDIGKLSGIRVNPIRFIINIIRIRDSNRISDDLRIIRIRNGSRINMEGEQVRRDTSLLYENDDIGGTISIIHRLTQWNRSSGSGKEG